MANVRSECYGYIVSRGVPRRSIVPSRTLSPDTCGYRRGQTLNSSTSQAFLGPYQQTGRSGSPRFCFLQYRQTTIILLKGLGKGILAMLMGKRKELKVVPDTHQGREE